MKLNYALMDPTGNMTVLVESPVEIEDQPRCAAALLAAEPTAEQVGFISPGVGGADTALRMAGGEFCGNAAMSAAALHCLRRGIRGPATLRLRVSGAPECVTVAVAPGAQGDFACTADMPRCAAPEEVSLALDGRIYRLPLLRFDGIAHLMLPGDFDRAAAEAAAPQWCALLGAEALGLMLLDAPAGRMTPLVYVRGGDTLYWERSCASGSAAAGAYLAWRSGEKTEVSLAQPGGILRVSALPEGEITLRGNVRLHHVGELCLE